MSSNENQPPELAPEDPSAGLAIREKLIQDREGQIQEAEAQLAGRLQELKAQQKAAGEDQARHLEQVSLDHGALATRTLQVEQAELEARSGFPRLRQEAMKDLAASFAAMQDELAAAEENLNTIRAQGIKKLLEELDQERDARHADLGKGLEVIRTQAEAAAKAAKDGQEAFFQGERKDAIDRLEQDRQRLQNEIKAFNQEADNRQKALDERERTLNGELAKLEFQKERLSARGAEWERSAEEAAKERVASLERKHRSATAEGEQLRDACAALQARVATLQEEKAGRSLDPERLQMRVKNLEAMIESRDKELSERPLPFDVERLATLKKCEGVWKDTISKQEAELADLRSKQEVVHRDENEKANLQQKIEQLQDSLNTNTAIAREQAEEVERLRRLYEKPSAEGQARLGHLATPVFLQPCLYHSPEPKSEMAWLDGLQKRFHFSGFRIPKRLLYQFHTALKTADLSPLTILAGVSGTGKSTLPHHYAHFGGLAFQDVAVQPNWDSPQSLHGYFNSIDNRFNATELLRAMVQSQKDPADGGLSDRLLLVLLDEMNLARVEHYFSEQISRLGKPMGEGQQAVLPIDLGAGREPYLLPLGRNILWVGTMNEDETTMALSDKVIDRSNLLCFPRPRTLHAAMAQKLGPAQPLMLRATWEAWIVDPSPFEQELSPFRKELEAMNGHLEKVGRALGHRVWQSVERYLVNHPEVREARANPAGEPQVKGALRRAFEDQLVLKVMPKLRGIPVTGTAKANCIEPIKKQLADTNLTRDFEQACQLGYGTFMWGSAEYLEEAP